MRASTGAALGLVGLMGLGACAATQGSQGPATTPSPVEQAAVDAAIEARLFAGDYQRAFERLVTEEPFEYGELSVVATEDGELSTYGFVPCGGAAVCAGGPHGPQGRVLRTPDYFVVAGLHHRLFWLSYGGDGWVERNGAFVPLAWNARPLGTGDGREPALEAPAPHG